MPPTLGGTGIRRPLSAIVSASAVLALTFTGAIPTATPSVADDTTQPTPTATATATATATEEATAQPTTSSTPTATSSASATPTPTTSASATPTATASPKVTTASSSTTSSVSKTAKANAYTDRKHTKTSHKNVRTPKVNRTRYAAYYAFSGIGLASGAQVVSVTLKIQTKASSVGSGSLRVHAVSSGWSGSRVTFRSRPSVSSSLGSAKAKRNGTVTITLRADVAAAYVASGLSIRITRSGSNKVIKLNRKPTLRVIVRTPTTNPTTPTTSAVISGKPVFALYFPPYPLSLDNLPPSKDYYTVNYLKASGENNKWAAVGGLLRDRPVPRDPISGDYQYADMLTEVKQAIDYGLNGFTACVLTTDSSDRNYYLIEKLMKASSALSSSFKVMLMPDMTAMPNISADDLAKGMAALSKYSSVYKLSTGEVLIAPFYAEGHSASYYQDMLNLMRTKYNTPAALMPIFLDANYMSSFNSVSVAFANWGIRDAKIASNEAYWPNWVAKAHALGKPWMEPVSVQDERPNQRIYDEASNTETLRATWNRATTEGADLVMMTTWNDYSESTSFAPSTDHGYAFLELNKYYLTKYRTGSYPSITKDRIIITHRIQKASTLPTSYTGVMTLRNPDNPAQTRPRDKIEVFTMLTAAATVKVTIGDKTYSYSAPAGTNAQLFDLAEGYFTATASRGDSTVATVTTKDAVAFTTEQQDLSYHAVMSK